MYKQKGFSNILGIVLILVIIAGGIYVYLEMGTGNTDSAAESVKRDWDTYETTEYSIQYPPGWNAGINMKHDASPVVFCPPELASNTDSVCQTGEFEGTSRAGGYTTKAPIIISTYGKLTIPEKPTATEYYWEVSKEDAYEGKARYVLKLTDEKYRDVYEEMVESLELKK